MDTSSFAEAVQQNNVNNPFNSTDDFGPPLAQALAPSNPFAPSPTPAPPTQAHAGVPPAGDPAWIDADPTFYDRIPRDLAAKLNADRARAVAAAGQPPACATPDRRRRQTGVSGAGHGKGNGHGNGHGAGVGRSTSAPPALSAAAEAPPGKARRRSNTTHPPKARATPHPPVPLGARARAKTIEVRRPRASPEMAQLSQDNPRTAADIGKRCHVAGYTTRSVL